MNSLVFVTGDFCSGSTLLFTLFRKSGEFHCLYEPLHEKLAEYLHRRLKPDEHHYFVENYFQEYRGFRDVTRLHRTSWGLSDFYLGPDDRDDALYRYLSYLIGASFARVPRVLLKENRLAFRSGWIRATFPGARIIHIWRDCPEQWKSVVSRGQAYLRRQDIGQDSVAFNGFNIGTWSDDLSATFPILRAEHSESGYQRFSKLWELSREESQRHADLSINYGELVRDFDRGWGLIRDCAEMQTTAVDLRQFIVPPDKKKAYTIPSGWHSRVNHWRDRVAARQAHLRLRMRTTKAAPAAKLRGARPDGG
jgi:hypothetical protein